MAKIFLVEDDHTLRDQLMFYLQGYGYQCVTSNDFLNIINLIFSEKPDLILLDINLPEQDGYHICREIRRKSMIPIIVVTSRTTDLDELMSINLGADDFIAKPYNTQILLARIAALLRRQESIFNIQKLEYNGLIFFADQSIVEYCGCQIELTKNERCILQLLFKHKGKIVSRDSFMEELWQSDEFIDDNTLTVNINRLRRKLAELGAKNMISTHRGQGYRL
ncbi:MAG: response regulator transcription factor [Peptococcaceae bacterium]|nr:response regulator transcription factor [Peptococcaceae bacterium]